MNRTESSNEWAVLKVVVSALGRPCSKTAVIIIWIHSKPGLTLFVIQKQIILLKCTTNLSIKLQFRTITKNF